MIVEIYEKGKDSRGKPKDRLKDTKIYIGQKEINLKFTVPIYLRMEDEICTLDDLYSMLHGQDRWHEDKIPALVSLMTGGEVTPKEILQNSDVATLNALKDKIAEVVATSVRMREKKYDDDDSVHDEVLEEIEKKEAKAD